MTSRFPASTGDGRVSPPAGPTASEPEAMAPVQRTAPLTIGRFRVLAELGRGGMGTVYRAADQVTGQEVALKVLELSTDTTVALFEREYQTLASIDHPCVPTVYDFGVGENESRYYTMELIEGQDMHALAPMDWRGVCRHLRDVGMALSCLHVRGLLHRDISPRNIRINERGRAKLIDFGALAPFGMAQQLVGTPACSAPEPLRRIPLDQRADLFSLGATGYMALTRQRPFLIKRWADAETGWQTLPRPPSDIIPGIPRELDELILALLQLDKRARPESVADVIERLERIAGIEDEVPTLAQSAPLASGGMVGREGEQARLLTGLLGALKGRGSTWIVEGPPRSGRGRLAQELSIAARLKGAIAVSAAGEGPLHTGGAIKVLMRALAESAPAEVSHALRGKAGLLETFPELRPLFVDAPPAASATNSLGRNGDGFAAVPAFIARVASQRPLLIVVDDVHAVDQISAGTLMAISMLAATRPIMLLLTIREQAPLPSAIRHLLQSSYHVPLPGLSVDKVGGLVESVFGRVEHGARLSQWLHRVAGGNVGHSLDILRDLVDRGVIRRLSGSWTLPQDLMGQELPENLAEALRHRLRGMSATATELARALALYGVAASGSLCERFLPERSPLRVRRALSELAVRQVVAANGDSHQVPLQELRTGLLAPLSQVAVAELHARVGAALLGELEGVQHGHKGVDSLWVHGLRLRAGFHLLFAGDERGGALLPDAAIALTQGGEGLVELVPTLESALNLMSERDDTDQRYAVIAPLIVAGTYMDPRLTYRYADEVLAVLTERTGMNLATRLSRFLPGRIALALGVATAVLKSRWSRRHPEHNYREVMLGLMGLTTAILGTYAALVDAVQAQRVLQRAHGLSLFPRKHPAAVVFKFQQALCEVARGEYGAAEKQAIETLVALAEPRVIRQIPEGARHQLVHGLCVALGSIACFRSDGQVGQWLAELDRMPLAQARESAAGIRANYYANRGEMRHSQHYRGLVDNLAAQGAGSWQQDLLIPRCLWWIEVQCEDALGLRRTLRKLEPMATEGSPLATVYAAAHACYMAERGLQREALVRYGPLLEEATQSVSVYGLRLVGAYARLLRTAGQAERARTLCEQSLSALRPDDRQLTCLVHGVELERLYALLALGELEVAAADAQAMVLEQSKHDNPLLHALSQRLLAQVALAQGNRARFTSALAAMEIWCRRAENPALFRQVQRLHSARRSATADSADGVSATGSQGAESDQELDALASALASCDDANLCADRALRWLADYSRSPGAALCLARAPDPELLATHGDIELSTSLWLALKTQRAQWTAAQHQHSLAPTEVGPSHRRRVAPEASAMAKTEVDGYHISPLLASQGLGGELVGFVVLRVGSGRLRPLPWEALCAISDALQLITD